MIFFALVLQILISVIIPLIIIDWQYKKNGKYNWILILVFGIINLIFILGLNVTLYFPHSIENKWWWIVDAAVFILPIIAEKIALNIYPTFDKFKEVSYMSFETKERTLMQVSDGVKKCCEELRGSPDDLRIFLNGQIKDATVTELQATLLFEKFSSWF